MIMPGRSWSNGNDYRYSHNGHEKEDAIFAGALSAEHWMYDSRILRRWERDPVVKPWESPYAAFSNNPIVYADPHGLTAEKGNGDGGGKKKKGDLNIKNKIEVSSTDVAKTKLDNIKSSPNISADKSTLSDMPNLEPALTGNGPMNGQPQATEAAPAPLSNYYNGVSEIRIYDFNNPRAVANNNQSSQALLYPLGEPNWAEMGRQQANTGGFNAGVKNSNMGISTNGNVSFSNNGANVTMNPNGTFGGGYNGYGVNATGFSTPFGGASGNTSFGNFGGGIVHSGLNGPVIGTVNASYVNQEASITANYFIYSGGIYSQTLTTIRNFTPANGGAATSQTVDVEKTKGFSFGAGYNGASASGNFNIK